MPREDIPSLAMLRRKSRQPTLFADPPAASPATPSEPRIFTVSQLIGSLRALVERTHFALTVEGEISNWKPSASGHCYFTLKDATAQLSVVLFRADAARLTFRPKDGDAVRLRGRLSVYDPRGQLQLIASSLQPIGLGALLAAVQELKQRLRREGLFDRHRPLPAFPRCIGVLTSLHGAALRDIIKVCRRRHSSVNLLVYPVAVQGAGCAAEVTRALRWFARHAAQPGSPYAVDVLLLARGGGSLEDLHGFNAEPLVRALAASPIPTLTGIGHATDTVLADLAADACAPTPSATAELLTAGHFQLEARVHRLAATLHRAQQLALLRTHRRLDRHAPTHLLRVTLDSCNRLTQRCDALESRLERFSVQGRHAAAKGRLATLSSRLERAASLNPRIAQLDRATHRLDALSPLRVLDRGYALVYGPDGHLLHSTKDLRPNDLITARLQQGTLHATVTSTRGA